MKSSCKKIIALMLAVITLFGICTAASAGSVQTDSINSYYKGVLYYHPGLAEAYGQSDLPDSYVYSDDFFTASGNIYNEHLSTFSMIAAEASVGSAREPLDADGYARKSRNLSALLEDVGFSDIEVNEDYATKPTKNSMGALCAHKSINDDGKNYTLIAVIPRSANYEAEWGGDFVIGSEGDSKGFSIAADICLDFTKNYIADKNISGDIKVWITGFSRGGAVSNLIAKNIIDSPKGCLGDNVNLRSDDLYAYTFSTPSPGNTSNAPRAEKYAGIFNTYSNIELISAMPPLILGFDRYGTDRLLSNEENYSQMLSNLKICNELFYNVFTTEYNPRFYYPKKLSTDNGSIEFVNDDSSYIPYDPKEYIAGFAKHFAQTVGGRKNYASEYEQPLTDSFAYAMSLHGDQLETLADAAINHSDLPYLFASMYSYFIKSRSGSLAFTAADDTDEDIASVAADVAETGLDASLIAKISAKMLTYSLMSADRIKNEGAGYLKNIFTAALNAVGAPQEVKSSIITDKNMKALFHLASYLLLGNIWQSGKISSLDKDNQAIKNAATLIGNAANICYEHCNEVTVSWLRTEDSYYDDYSELTQSQIKGYRRVYISASDNAILNGKITYDDGNVAALIENGRLTGVTDSWIGFTNTDDGGFFRIPADKSYKIKLTSDRKSAINTKIYEYQCSDGSSVSVMDKTVSVSKGDDTVIKLPKLMGDWSSPSGAKYNATVESAGKGLLGDADNDGEVTITDAAAVQRKIIFLPCPVFNEPAADVDSDGEVTVIDATFIQRFSTNVEVSFPIGKPIS